MPTLHSTRTLAAIATLTLCFQAHGQMGSSLPPTAPTSLVAPLAATPTPAVPANLPRRASVTYSNGLLEIRANNASLHQILRAIARTTGMTITGGVADERVFGDYGPATPTTILDTLLDGMGINILLKEGPQSQPVQLVMTPRGGGPTPAVDMQAADADPEPAPEPAVQRPATYATPQRPGGNAPQTLSNGPLVRPAGSQSVQVPPSLPQPLNNINGNPNNTTPAASDLSTVQSVPTDSLPTPASTQAVSGIVDSTNPPPSGSTTPPTANQPAGASTPDSIYQQLLKIQQQKQQQTTPATAPQ